MLICMLDYHIAKQSYGALVQKISRHVVVCAGRWVPPPADWDRLDQDVWRVVMSRLSLRTLASLSALCKIIKQAYLDKALSERARLLAVTTATFGQDTLAALVTSLAFPLCGLGQWPDIPNHQREGNVPRRGVAQLVYKWAEQVVPRHAQRHDAQ